MTLASSIRVLIVARLCGSVCRSAMRWPGLKASWEHFLRSTPVIDRAVAAWARLSVLPALVRRLRDRGWKVDVGGSRGVAASWDLLTKRQG
jgi:hypothetical protein